MIHFLTDDAKRAHNLRELDGWTAEFKAACRDRYEIGGKFAEADLRTIGAIALRTQAFVEEIAREVGRLGVATSGRVTDAAKRELLARVAEALTETMPLTPEAIRVVECAIKGGR
jgi:hypothetical protein